MNLLSWDKYSVQKEFKENSSNPGMAALCYMDLAQHNLISYTEELNKVV